jgi:hypothetical protein
MEKILGETADITPAKRYKQFLRMDSFAIRPFLELSCKNAWDDSDMQSKNFPTKFTVHALIRRYREVLISTAAWTETYISRLIRRISDLFEF